MCLYYYYYYYYYYYKGKTYVFSETEMLVVML